MERKAGQTANAVVWSPAWRLDLDSDGDPILTAGVDRQLALRATTRRQREILVSWAGAGPIDPDDASEAQLADRLLAIGALIPAAPTPRTIHCVGDHALGSKLVAAMEAEPAAPDQDDAFTILLRTGGDWPEPPGQAHLAVDCSMHHTLVLGPYVVPGLSACTRCLTTRMARRWPEVTPPPEPAVQRHLDLVAELVRIQADLVSGGASPLVNATIAWDLEQGTCERQTLLKSPGCPRCDAAPRPGRLMLSQDASP